MLHHPLWIRACAAASVAAFAGTSLLPAQAAIAPALAKAFAHDSLGGCSVADAEKTAGDKVVTLSGGVRVHFMQAACAGGASNQTLAAYVADGASYRNVLLDNVQVYKATPDGTVVDTGEDNYALSYRTTYRWNGHTYAEVSDVGLYMNKYEKPVSTIRFLPGTSSAVLSGNRVAQRFPDVYKFAAARGQQVVVRFLRRDPKVSQVAIVGGGATPNDDKVLDLTHSGPSYTVEVPTSGTYHLEITSDDDTFRSYRLKFLIR